MSAVVDFQNTTYVNNTAQLVFTGVGHITAIEVQPHQQQVNTVWVNIWDSVTVAVDAQTALVALPVVAVGTSGAGTDDTDGVAFGGQKRCKFVFPGKGIEVGTGIMVTIATALGGNTAATTTSLPPMLRVFFVPDHV